MRLKKVKDAKEIIEKSNYLIKDPKNYIGKYKKFFSNKNIICVEIGTGKGDFLIEMAKKHPNINYIGIEKADSVLVRAIQKIDILELANIKFILMDALEINEIFKKEIETLYLNFSDPWPKNKHANRRLTSPLFLDKYDSIFKDKKEIRLKTDNRKFFEYSLIELVKKGYMISDLSLNLYDDFDKNSAQTEYETKFLKNGYNIYQLIAIKE